MRRATRSAFQIVPAAGHQLSCKCAGMCYNRNHLFHTIYVGIWAHRPLNLQSKELFYAASVPNRFSRPAAPLPAGAAGGFSADHPGAGGLFCAGAGLRHLCAVLGSAGVDAHAHGYCRVRRLAGVRAGKFAAGRVLAAVGLFNGADDPGAAPFLRPCHAGAL